MDETTNDYEGEILLERVRNTRPIRSFIQKRIRGWLEAHGFGGDRGAHYRIALNKHRQGHMFTCHVEIDGADSRWSALVTAPDLHQAIVSALNHMAAHPTPLATGLEKEDLWSVGSGDLIARFLIHNSLRACEGTRLKN